MNDLYNEIKNELEQTRDELLESLNKYKLNVNNYMDRFNDESVANLYENEKKTVLTKHLKDELKDVNRALLKFEFGLYGICEETGKRIPEEQLKVLPTVRKMDESPFVYQKEKRQLFVH